MRNTRGFLYKQRGVCKKDIESFKKNLSRKVNDIMSQTNDDFKSQRFFWKYLQQTKFELNYCDLYYRRCINISRSIKYTNVVLTTFFSGIWMGWSNIAWVNYLCGGFIVVLQAMAAVTEYLPYDKRKWELERMKKELDEIYDNMEDSWNLIADGLMTEKQIGEKLECYKKQKNRIRNDYFADDYLPEVSSVVDRACKKTQKYFNAKIKE